MHLATAVPQVAQAGADQLLGPLTVLLGGALVPFLLSVIPDLLTLGIQRRRWRPLLALLPAVAAVLVGSAWTRSLAAAAARPGTADRVALADLLLVVGLVAASVAAVPRVLRAVRHRRRTHGRPAPLAASRPALAS